jgi:3',5'-nucleoside bisphosphate phosphatase
MTVDLQIHTVATPHHAIWTPEALAEAAAAAGLQVIAVTDHNTMASVQAAQAAGARQGLRVIAGVEIDSGFAAGGQSDAPTKLWHTLVYGAPPDDPALLALCEAVFARNQADATALQAELTRRGFQIAGLDILGRPPNVADVGAALARQNQLPGRQAGDDDESAGMRYILEQVPGGYRPVGVDEVIAVAHQAGGLAVLAHPGRSKGVYAIPATAEDIAAMAAAGLDGIEVLYPSHSAEQRAFYHELAQRHGLLITGGSDSHGPQQALAAWPIETCKLFLEQVH